MTDKEKTSITASLFIYYNIKKIRTFFSNLF